MSDLQNEIPEPVDVKDKPFHCLVCGHDHFIVRNAQLNKAISTFFSLDWADRSATCLICAECTYIHWFYGRR